MKEFENRVGGIEKMTMLDYPDKIAAILFYNGCRTCRCPYCYNKNLWSGNAETIDSEEVVEFLKKRRKVLDAVVFSGGECTTWGEALKEDIAFVKDLGYLVKVDTNGTNTALIQELYEEKLVDYYALDVKCPPKQWKTFYTNEVYWNNFLCTLDMLLYNEANFETRTTVHTSITTEDDVNEILHMLHGMGYMGKHYLQFFFNNGKTEYLDDKLELNPREFDVNKLIIPEDITVELRNEKNRIIDKINP